jgi:hypothetical protein
LTRQAIETCPIGKFELPFTEYGGCTEHSLAIYGELDLLHARFSTTSRRKQAWMVNLGAKGLMAELLSHLGSQFDGIL